MDAYESNNYTQGVAVASAGDVLRIERSGSDILYKLNGTTVRTVATDPGLELSIEGFLRYIGTYVDDVKDIRCSFGIPYGAYPVVTNVQANQNGTGAIDLNVKGGVAPYTYSWGDGATTSSRTGLNAGTYTVTVTDANSQTVSTSIVLDYEVEWANTAYVTTTGSSITKTTTTTVNDAGGSSINYLPANTDGYLEFVYLDKLNTYVIGLGTNFYGYYYEGMTNAMYIHNGISYYDGNVYTNAYIGLNSGDIIRIERSGSQVFYKVNGAIIRTVSVDPSLKLEVLIGINGSKAGCPGIHTSFPVKYDTYVNVTDQVPGTPKSVGIRVF
jgi:hypothetical protein